MALPNAHTVTIGQILRLFVHQQHHDWLNCLSFAEFAYNNTLHSATKFSTFDALYKLNSKTPANLLTNNPTSAPLDVTAKIYDVHALISEQLKVADVYEATYYNRRSKPFEFAENDFVRLSTTDLLLRNQPCTEIRQRFIGPYATSAKQCHMPTASASPNPCNA
jgi:hypothetical protein